MSCWLCIPEIQIESLTLVGKDTEFLMVSLVGGTTYHLAVVVDEATQGDVFFRFNGNQGNFAPSIVVPGNLLCEPSFEGTGLNFTCWHDTSPPSGYVNERGGADGSTWPVFDTGAQLWQEFSTVPGHLYKVNFAFRPDMGATAGSASVLWDTHPLGVANAPDGAYWHWTNFYVLASNLTSRLTISLNGRLGLDAFSVVDATAPPEIITQPVSISTLAGGSAYFFVSAEGSPTLHYQWYFNSQALAGQTNPLIALNSATTNNVGDYQIIITNAFGAVTSSVAKLSVDVLLDATILTQPYGDIVPLGGYYNFSVIAAGDQPLTYQWQKDGVPLTGATQRNLSLTNILLTDGGTYRVQVLNSHSSVLSLPAVLEVSTNYLGGGWINFLNKFTFPPSNSVPIFNVDGVTPLSGSQFVAQLYAGPALESIRPAGVPTPFMSGANAGLFVPEMVQLPNVPVGGDAFLQVRVWDSEQATSYEEARATGAKFGKSEILEQNAGNAGLFAPQMQNLQSFSLQAGLPYFNVGTIHLINLQSDGKAIWELAGSPGFRYLIEKNSQFSTWQPFTVVTNVVGTVIFTDFCTNSTGITFYRARILD
jgi:hypothetical protein